MHTLHADFQFKCLIETSEELFTSPPSGRILTSSACLDTVVSGCPFRVLSASARRKPFQYAERSSDLQILTRPTRPTLGPATFLITSSGSGYLPGASQDGSRCFKGALR